MQGDAHMQECEFERGHHAHGSFQNRVMICVTRIRNKFTVLKI